ncbi:unnamed protein product, partial [Nesidiocoris tenuis]
MKGIMDPAVRDSVFKVWPPSMDEALKVALRMEAVGSLSRSRTVYPTRTTNTDY